MPFRGGFLSVSVYLLCLPFLFLSVPSRATESYSSVGQSATLIMWRSAVCKQGVNGSNPLFSTCPVFWASIFDMLSHKVKTKKSRLCIL